MGYLLWAVYVKSLEAFVRQTVFFFLQDITKICRTDTQTCLLSKFVFCEGLQDISAGQNENLPVLSDSLAVFA